MLLARAAARLCSVHSTPLLRAAARPAAKQLTTGAPHVGVFGHKTSRYKQFAFAVQVLRFLFTEINYGGRVTDAKDRRLISNLVTAFCNEDVLKTGYAFSPDATYTTPCAATIRICFSDRTLMALALPQQERGIAQNRPRACSTVFMCSATGKASPCTFNMTCMRPWLCNKARRGCRGAETVRQFQDAIRSLPANPSPDIFGLHANADITSDQNETYDLFATILSLQPRGGGGGGGKAGGSSGGSREAVLVEQCGALAAKVPPQFDLDAIQEKYPTKYEESMNTVLTQECIRCAA